MIFFGSNKEGVVFIDSFVVHLYVLPFLRHVKLFLTLLRFNLEQVFFLSIAADAEDGANNAVASINIINLRIYATP